MRVVNRPTYIVSVLAWCIGLGIGLALAVLLTGCAAPSAPATDTSPPTPVVNLIGTTPPSTEQVVITKVYDADTYTLEDGRKVRILGIDAPELRATAGLTKEQAEAEKCYGKQAAAAARTIALGEKVTITGDPEQGDRDRYGRLLRYVTLPDGTDLGARLLADGMARVYDEYRVAKSGSYQLFEDAANKGGTGGWADQPIGCGWTE